MVEVYASPDAPRLRRLLDMLRRGSAVHRVRDAAEAGPLGQVVVNVDGRWWLDPAAETIALAVGVPIEVWWEPPRREDDRDSQSVPPQSGDVRAAEASRFGTATSCDGLDRLRLMMLRASGVARVTTATSSDAAAAPR